MFAMNNDTSDSVPMSLDFARKVLEGRAGPVSTKEAADIILKEMDRLNGVINSQARCIADVRKALGIR